MASLLQASSISRRYGGKLLFADVDFFVDEGDKIAIVGLNGSGKSSLLKIISGDETPDTGQISLRRDIKIAVLHQDYSSDPDKTILQAMLHDGSELQECIAAYEKALLGDDSVVLQQAIEKMDAMQAWNYESRMKQILSRLKIEDVNRKISTLSGGQKKRVALASVLVVESDLLILDEPTNHLDLDMIEWLEDYLDNEVKSLVMITHDRYFLDRVCTRIAEIEKPTVFFYEGNYSRYIELKNLRDEAMQAGAEKARNLLRTEIEWLRRMPKARTHKSKYRIKTVGELSDKAHVQKSNSSINIRMEASRLGSKVLNLKNISKSYGDKKVLSSFSYVFAPYEKVGIVGNNGTGKTTLLNIINSKIFPDTGTVSLGDTVKLAYYTQDGLRFDDSERPIDVVSKIADVVKLSDGNTVSASAFLQMFRFQPPQQYDLISKLSGGEKQRLYLCTVLMQQPNFLILDEPTNDLDIITLQVLEDYLVNFKGCVLIVSHDRFFLDKIVDHVFVFSSTGSIKDFPGNYSQYRYSKEFAESPKPLKQPVSIPEKKQTSAPAKSGLTYKERLEIQQIEMDLKSLETLKQEINNKISESSVNQIELFASSKQLGEVIIRISELELRWFELSAKADV